MDSILPADGLFKQQKPSDAGTEEEERLRKHQRNLKNAITHALLLQQRKDVEMHILETIETLTELPASATPTAAERQKLAEGVAPFQPGDYDDLVDERVAQARCGYTLCLKKPRSASTKSWALTIDAGKFCSSSCQQRSVRIKIQLDPVPVWERGSIVQIVLPDSINITPALESSMTDPNAELAFERGEKVTSKKSEAVMSAEIVEQKIVGQASPPQPSSDTIEGYVPKNQLPQEEIGQSDVEIDQPPREQVTHSMVETNQPPQNPPSPPLPEDDEEQQWRDMFENLRVQRQG